MLIFCLVDLSIGVSGVLKSPAIIVLLLVSPFTIQEEDITIINIYAPNIGALWYVRQMLTSMKGEINNNTIIVGDFNTPTHTYG